MNAYKNRLFIEEFKITLNDLRSGKEREEVYHYEEGIKEFVSYVNEGKGSTS